jgi:ATP-binding cassette subfamily B protein
MTKTFAEPLEITDPSKPQSHKFKSGKIHISNVSFRYKDSADDDLLFRNFSLDIESGTKVGLVGPSGGGKTSITKLLLRLVDPDEGKILIDSQNIKKITQFNLRQNIAFVPQEPVLFHRSLADNIKYGNIDATPEMIKKASKDAHADVFIEKLPKKYETLVGERGTKLSGGEKQRVAIARAMLRNAPILILDEATSALDSESEKLIQSALNNLMKNRTTIVIAHRLSTIQKMDRIVVLDEGKVIEDGSHQELIDNKGKYAELWSHQSGGFIED